MLYSQSPPLAEDDAAQDNSPRAFSRDQEARSEPQFGRRSARAPIYASYTPRRSIGRRMFSAIARFVILISIGVGVTLGWQAYGDMGKQMLASYAPEHAWLLSYLPGTTKPLAVAAAPAASPALQLEPLAANLEFVRRSVEQIALKQEQVIRNIAVLQANDEEIRAKMTAPPPAPAQSMAAMPQPKPAAPKPLPPPGAPAARPSASAAPVSIAPR